MDGTGTALKIAPGLDFGWWQFPCIWFGLAIIIILARIAIWNIFLREKGEKYMPPEFHTQSRYFSIHLISYLLMGPFAILLWQNHHHYHHSDH